MEQKQNRDKVIIQTSIIGILANFALAGFKAVIGYISHSIAITMDAVNNLSDALSSVITIVGTKLAAKEPDKKHPLGHGRAEYLSAAVISVIILYAGVTSLVESIKKIIDPSVPDYSTAALLIVAAAVVVKILLGLFVKKRGKSVQSDSLIASGKDALFDSVISASTLLAAAIYLIFGISLEAWLGAIIAIVILKAGFDSLSETVSKILGQRADRDLTLAIKATINSFPEVIGTYDLVINNYGPNVLLGDVHLELPKDMTVGELDDLQYRIVHKVYEKYHVILNGISVYSTDILDPKAKEMCEHVRKVVQGHPEVINMHGFHLFEEEKIIRFDIIISFDLKNRREVYNRILAEVAELYPGYTLQVVLDYDISD